MTVCSGADEHCPAFPGQARIVHVGFEDPPKLTRDLQDGEAKLAVYRRVRDEIRRFVESLPAGLTSVFRPVLRSGTAEGGSPKTERSERSKT